MEGRAISGPVSRPRMRAMTAERLAGVNTSAMGGGRSIQYQTRNAECRREDWIDRRGAEVAKGR